MVKVGITGGIGSGKTLVCTILKNMGFPVYNADYNAKRITNSNPEVINSITILLGEDAYLDGEINKRVVAEKVFSNKNLLQKLNSIVHPAVAKDFTEWMNLHSQHSIVFKEAAILFESGAYIDLHKIIGVWAPKELRISRVCNRDKVTPDAVLQRMNNQMEEEELIRRSDFVIKNDENNLLLPQISSIITSLMSIKN